MISPLAPAELNVLYNKPDPLSLSPIIIRHSCYSLSYSGMWIVGTGTLLGVLYGDVSYVF